MSTGLMLLMAVAVFSSYCLGEGTEDTTFDVALQKQLNKIAPNLHEKHYENYENFISQKLKSRRRTEILQNIDQSYFIGAISAGTPPQQVNVIFDTGISYMWIKAYKYCEQIQILCETIKTYNRKDSSTFKSIGRNFSFQYITGRVGGELVQDNIYVAGLKINKQTFGEATSVDDDILYSKLGGIFGLSYSPEHSPNMKDVNPPIINMINQGLIKKPMFSIYLTKENSKKPSLLTFGGVKKGLFTGPFVFTPVVTNENWVIKLDNIILGKNQLTDTTMEETDSRITSLMAVADIGSTAIAGPSPLIDRINKAIHASYDPSIDTSFVDCKTVKSLPNITFVFSGHPLVLTPDNYIAQVTDDTGTHCFSGFYGVKKLHVVILGLPFLETFYTLFDFGKKIVGFARAV